MNNMKWFLLCILLWPFSVTAMAQSNDIELIDSTSVDWDDGQGGGFHPSTARRFLLTYMIDGEIVKSDSVVYGRVLTAEAAPEREGYTFSGWSEVPMTMPAHDVTVTGSFTVNMYVIRYYVNGQLVAEEEVEYGGEIVLRDYTPEDSSRYKFICWDGEKYETMPAHDIEYHANIADGINGVTKQYMSGIAAIFDIHGRKCHKAQRGVIILQMSDGTRKKFFAQ